MRHVLLSLVLVTGCASSGDFKPDRPRPTDPAQKEQLAEIDDMFMKGTEGLEAVVMEASADPIVAGWITRYCILHMADALQKQQAVQASLMFSGMEHNVQYQDALRLLVAARQARWDSRTHTSCPRESVNATPPSS